MKNAIMKCTFIKFYVSSKLTIHPLKLKQVLIHTHGTCLHDINIKQL
jgi:hypothetical protein